MPDPKSVMIIEVSCQRQWGNSQQQAVDSLLHWCAEISDAEALTIEASLREFFSRLGFGSVMPRAQGAQNAVDAMSKNR